ncbi:DNA primase [Denitratimonas sp. CY0512]|uniref:DNA primase n=1 Tax=Denitratimonas sp. CY0512 TaxID=3131940 RepID=UPI0030B2F8E9
MARIPDAFIDDLIARTDIVELIGSRVPLKRAGREHQGLCPFHDERTPSFTVSPTKQFYHCFGCGAHGSALRFLMEFERLEFLDAVEELARRAGMEVPRETRSRNEDGHLRRMYDTLAAASRWYVAQLASHATAQQYFKRRGIDAATCERFSLGYAPEGFDGLKNALGHDADALRLLESSGMLAKSDGGHVYDRFRERVMFPIHDRRGRPIAFGGRVLGKTTADGREAGPKYLNSPETPLFHKGRELYGLWQVRQAHSKIPRLIVVEGYMDVVALFQYGVTTAVATLGTATTPEHAELLFRNAADVFFCFDGDAAGRRAAWKALESVLPRMKDGRQAAFLFLPDGEDPDSLVRKEGSAGFEARLAQAEPLSEFFFREQGADINLHTLDGRARLAEHCKPLLEKIPDGAFRDLMFQRLSELTGLAASPHAATIPPPVPPAAARRHSNNTPRRSLVRQIITLLLHNPALGLRVEPPYAFAALRLPGIELLIEVLDLIHASPSLRTGGLLEHFAGREEADALGKLALIDIPGEAPIWQQELDDAIVQLITQTRQQRIEELKAQSPLSAAEKNELRELLLARVD